MVGAQELRVVSGAQTQLNGALLNDNGTGGVGTTLLQATGFSQLVEPFW